MTTAWDVFVVDDEAVVRDGITRILEARGLRTAAAPDGDAALAHPAAGACRLAICDVVLPDMSGVELAARLRRAAPSLPVVIMTGYATTDTVRQALAAGVSGFLPKPFDETELLAAVHDAWGKEAPS